MCGRSDKCLEHSKVGQNLCGDARDIARDIARILRRGCLSEKRRCLLPRVTLLKRGVSGC